MAVTSASHDLQRTTAVFEFIHYDEIGGTAGGADTDDTVEQPEMLAAEEEALPQPPQPEMESGMDLPATEEKAEDAVQDTVPDPAPDSKPVEVPEPELELEPEKEIADQAKPDPVFVDTPVPFLDAKTPDEEVLLADASMARSKPKRKTASDYSPPPAPPPTPLIVPSMPIDSAEEITGGGGIGDGHGGTGDDQKVGNPELLRAYASQIQRQLNQYKQYPAAARQYDIEGMVVVSFTVDTEGQVGQISMESSSGNTELDGEALSLPVRAAPFPGIPDVLHLRSIRLTMPINFSLR